MQRLPQTTVRKTPISGKDSYYRYASVDDFINDATPIGFGLTYGYYGNDAPGQMLTFGYGGLYAQDEWQVTPALKITYGVRLELPFYFDKMDTNKAILDKTAGFRDINYPDSGFPLKAVPGRRYMAQPK